MVTFIAYFEILGFKDFIVNNDKAYVDHNLGNLYRESQHALCGGHTVQGPTLLPGFSFQEVNCLHISDSILFWTDSATTEDFSKIIDVCQRFLLTSLQASFAVRGCLVAGDIEYKPFHITNNKGKRFDNSILYGQGLIDAYERAEAQDWAGCYIDESVFEQKAKDENGAETLDKLITADIIYNLIYDRKIVYYPVPFKDGSQIYHHAFRLIPKQINNVEFRNRAKGIEETFNRHMNGRELPPTVNRKLFNTIKFLESLRVPTEEPQG